MTSPNPDWDDIATTTLESRRKELADNVTKNNALLLQLSKKDKIDPVSGGEVILEELEFDGNGTYKRYDGYEILNITPSRVFTAASFTWKQAAVAVSISGKEMLQNSGEERMINLLTKRIGNAERTMRNGISQDIYSDGTADGAKQIGGLQHLVPDDPTTGTVGGIDRATYTWWQTNKFSATVDGSGAATAANIQSYMNKLWVQCVRGADSPDLIVADNNYWTLYLESLQNIQRITDDEFAQAGFQTLKYMGAPVVLDGGFGGFAPTNHMYFLNCDYIYFRPHRDRNMVPMNPNRYSVNQDAMVKLIGFMGNMTISNGFVHGVLIN